MLSIGPMSGGQGRYYEELAAEDYYIHGGEPPGRWWGAFDKIGLSERVTKNALHNLFAGRSPAGKDLVQNAGSNHRRPGFDFTFSAPKPVSVLWALAPDHIRREIQAAQDAAVKAALGYLQEVAGFTRTGKGGTEVHRAELIVALYEHSTSRAMDPNLHTHALIMNVGVMADGRTRALVAPKLFDEKMIAGALYRAELAAQLERRLGLNIERDGFAFKVTGILDAACDYFSKRRAAIEKELGARNLESAVAAAIAAKESREVKAVVPPRIELFAQWRQELGELFGLTPSTAEELCDRAPKRKRFKDESEMILDALEELTATRSHFAYPELLRAAAEAAQGKGLDLQQVRETVDGHIKWASESPKERKMQAPLVCLGTDAEGVQHFTTPEIQKLERKLLDAADRLRNEFDHGIGDRTVEGVLKKYEAERSPIIAELKHHAQQLWKAAKKKPTEKVDREKIRKETEFTLSAEQGAAVRHVTAKGGGSIRFIEGLAGTGKTSALRVAREIWEKAGYEVIGTTLGGKARAELEKGSGITSYTIAFLDVIMNKGIDALLRHHANQFKRFMQGKSVFDFEPFKFNNKSILVIDEAGMVDTKQLTKLISAVSLAGGMVVFVFHRDQIQAIGPGGAAAALADRYGKKDLKEVRRQKDPKDIEAAMAVLEGKADKALSDLKERGRLNIEKTREKAIEKLVSDWSKYERGSAHDALIFTGTNDDAQEINRRCQAARKAAGELGKSSVPVTAIVKDKGKERKYTASVCQGERIMLLTTSRTLGVNNGDTGTVIAVGTRPGYQTLTIELDNGKRVILPLKEYSNISLGYACTTNKGQGTTIRRSYVLLGGRFQDLQKTYVQWTRAQESFRLYADEREAGLNNRNLAKQIARSEEKTMAYTQSLTLNQRP